MKLNWGYSILIVIFTFVTGLSYLVYISFQQKINLVHKDYYPLEIEYQKMIDKENNFRALDQVFDISVNEQLVSVKFPEYFLNDSIVGEILFYRPSDFEEDRSIVINVDSSGNQNISIVELLKGKYLVKVDWTSNDVSYYFQSEIFINK